VLENSIWSEFHADRTIRETLAGLLGRDIVCQSGCEKELYAILKRHLTKKELRLFIMNEAGVDDAAIQGKTGIDAAAYEKAKKRVYSKIASKKISDEIKAIV
jgi:hypothetical protein